MIVPFMLGLLGSLHCIGMCGPIALALPMYGGSKFTNLVAILLYHLGRLCTYAFLGLVLGYFSLQVYFFGYQRYLSIGVGVFILLSVFPFLRSGGNYIFGNYVIVIQRYMSVLFQKKGMYIYALIGLCNGLLPCGFVYLALAGAATSQHWVYGIWFMFSFGLGTLPAMLSISILKNKITLTFRNRIKRVSPYMVFVMGLLLIIRGLNLGIPYLSPVYDSSTQAVPWCH